MTIGIGLLCTDGVVLCSDRQITTSGGSKYSKRKIFTAQRNNCTAVFSYAGDPDAAEMMFGKVSDALPEIVRQASNGVSPDRARGVLEKIFRDKHSKGLQTLIGMHMGNQPSFLMKTFSTKVVNAYAEYIGFGDCSALRYLSDFIFPSHLNVFEGVTLGAYLVSVASRYIDGCSGGPDHVILKNEDGMTTSGSGGAWPNARERIGHCEQQMGKGLRELLFAAGNGELVVKPLTARKSELAR